jgi:hypothetical protein
MPNNTLFGLAIQQDDALGTEALKMAGGYERMVSEDANFSYHILTDMGMAPIKSQDNLPPEIGGRALPTGAYVAGIWAEGPASMICRLDNRFGWLLLAALGSVSTVADTTIENLAFMGAGPPGADAGINSHIFEFLSTDQYFVPWVTIRKLLPHTAAANQVGEVYQDGHIRTLTITGAAGAPVTADIDILARVNQNDYVFDYNPGWATPTYDDFDNFGVTSCEGHFRVGSTDFRVTNVSLTLSNQLLGAAQSIIVGDVDPVDFPNLGRFMQVTATFLVDNYDLYVDTFRGSSTGSGTDANVSCTVYQADLDVLLASQTYISGTEAYKLRIVSNPDEDNVAWTVQPLRIQPNQPVVLQVTGSIQAIASGYPVYIMLQNAAANYNMP